MRSLLGVCMMALVGLAVGVAADSRRNSAVNEQGCKSSYAVDYVKLAIQWQPGYCATSSKLCTNYKPVFSIHGLWPNAPQAEELGFCCVRDKFSSNQLSHLVGLLKQDWPSMEGDMGSSRGFWEYQYKKHGTCADKIKGLSGAYNYFSFALRLFQKILDPKLVLERKGIVPSDSRTYSGQTIANVLSAALGNKVALDCKGSQKEPTPVLKHIYVCVDTDLNRIGCPYTKRACLGEIKYPLTANKK